MDIRFDGDRVSAFLKALERIAAGHLDDRLTVSSADDTLDAIAGLVNSLVSNASQAAARNGAILKAIPDLMFVHDRDGKFIDYHARDPKMLFVPPSAFIGRTLQEVLPPPLGEQMAEALEQASRTDDTVVVEYELPVMEETRYFEARIVRKSTGRLLTIVREITEARRAAQLNRELARRLISRQEIERQRIARDLHDDISQRIAVLKVKLDQMTTRLDADLGAQLRALSEQAGEIAFDVHHVSYELHPSRLRTLGLVPALQSLCNDMSKQRDVQVAFTYDGPPHKLDEDVSLCLYRIVQEALHNVSRHSRAREATVRLTRDAESLVLHVSDAGVGFDPARTAHEGLGLVSIRERAASLNGEVLVDAVPGQGTRITVRIPLAPDTPTLARPAVAST